MDIRLIACLLHRECMLQSSCSARVASCMITGSELKGLLIETWLVTWCFISLNFSENSRTLTLCGIISCYKCSCSFLSVNPISHVILTELQKVKPIIIKTWIWYSLGISTLYYKRHLNVTCQYQWFVYFVWTIQ